MAAIIFDFDGTIADSFETVIKIFHELTGRHDLIKPAEIERLRGLTLVQAIEELHVHPWKVPFLVIRGRRRMRGRIGQVEVYRGMSEVIRSLHDSDHQLFIVSSNSQKNIRLFLRRHRLEQAFINLYGSVGLLGKARTLKKVLKRNHLDPKTTWYVGDEVRDISGAQHAGLRVIAVTWGFNNTELLRAHHPTSIAETPAELLGLLQ